MSVRSYATSASLQIISSMHVQKGTLGVPINQTNDWVRDSLISPQENSTVGSMSQCWREWWIMGASPLVIRALRYGVTIPPPQVVQVQSRILVNPVTIQDEMIWMRMEIGRLQVVGAIEKMEDSHSRPVGIWQSKMRLAPKKGPKRYRLIVNMRPFNMLIPPPPYFKMENLGTILKVLQPKWWMCSWDLRDGYFQVSLNSNSHHWFGVHLENSWYTYKVLPFGWSYSPYWFCTIIHEAVKHWRSMGMLVVAYVDDFLLMAPSKEILLEHRTAIEVDMSKLGIIREPTKGHWIPTQHITFLGLEIDTMTSQIIIPEEKVLQLIQHLRDILVLERVSVRSLASVAGKLISVSRAFSPARLYTRRLYATMKKYQLQQWDWDSYIVLSIQDQEDIQWLINNLRTFNGHAAWEPTILPQLVTDASTKVGWGGILNGQSAGGYWSQQESHDHINKLELLAVLRSLESFHQQLQGQSITIATDSIVAEAYINNGGGTSEPLTSVIRQIWEWCVLNRVTIIKATWIPGKENKSADFQSRWLDPNDWRLSQVSWDLIERRWGPHTMDRMADSQNSKCGRFNSIRWCPGTSGVDCFTQNWEKENNYVCPPINLIARVLKHLKYCNAKGTIIVPKWPAQPWWPLLLSMQEEWICLGEPYQVFLQGKSRMVEPWKNSNWEFLAVRITPHGLI